MKKEREKTTLYIHSQAYKITQIFRDTGTSLHTPLYMAPVGEITYLYGFLRHGVPVGSQIEEGEDPSGANVGDRHTGL